MNLTPWIQELQEPPGAGTARGRCDTRGSGRRDEPADHHMNHHITDAEGSGPDPDALRELTQSGAWPSCDMAA